MRKRKIISLSIFITFFIISVTGVIMYFFPHSRITSAIHSLFGAIFTALAIWHLVNNFVSIKSYTIVKKTKKFSASFMLILSLATSLLFYGLYNGELFQGFYNYGNEIRSSQRGVELSEDKTHQKITLQDAIGNKKIELELKKGSEFSFPLFAFWLEDINGNYLQTLYVSESISTSTFDYGKEENGEWSPDIVRRPEALPVWSHKRGKKAKDGYYIPLKPSDSKDIDAYSGATPTDNFSIETMAKIDTQSEVFVFMEVNQSYDWNEFYHKDLYPQDKIYSGSGQVGQPALVYKGKLSSNKEIALLELTGRSHHSGRTGLIYSDLDEISTAKNIVEYVLVKILS